MNMGINSSPMVTFDVIEELKVTHEPVNKQLVSLKRDIAGKNSAPSVISCRPMFYPSPSGAFVYI